MLTQEGLLNKESNQDKKGKKTGLTVGGLLKKKDQDGSAVSEEPVEQPGESTEESSIPVVENLQEALEKPLEKPLEEYIPEKPEEAQLKIHPDNTVGQNQLAVLKSELDKNKQLAKEDEVLDKESRKRKEELLSELDNGISRVSHVFGKIDQTIVGAVGNMSQEIAIGAKWLNEEIINLGGPDVGQPVEEYVTYKFGKAIQDWAKEMFPTNPKYEHDFWLSTLPSGAGSMIAIMLGGGLTRAITSTATKGLLREAEKNVYKKAIKNLSTEIVNNRGAFMVSGAMMGVPEYENAKASGVSDQEAFEVFLWNYAIGTTDAIPIAITLNRFNKFTGGGVIKYLNNLGKQFIEGGTREMIQEVGQNYLTNLTAQNYYDEFRKLYQGMAEEGAAGFILGGLLGSAGAVSITKNLPKAEKEKLDSFISEEQENLKENVGDFGPIPPVGPIPPAGPATVVQTIDQNLKQAETTDANQLDKLATQVQQQVDKTQGEKPIVEETKVENVGQTEIKSEAEQDTPVQQEAPIVTVGNENYSVTNEGGALTIKDAQGNEIPSENVIKSGKNKGKRVPNPKYQQAVKQYHEELETKSGIQKIQHVAKTTDKDTFLNSVIEIPISDIDPGFDESTIKNITSTRSTNPNDPVTIGIENGKPVLLDGAHRFYEKKLEGSKTIKVRFTPNQGAEQLYDEINKSKEAGPGIGDTESKSPETATVAPPPTPTGDKETSPKKKKRRFAQQILNDPNIRKEVKEGLSEDAVNYVPLSNEVTNKEANAIIESKGIDESIKLIKDTKNGMHGAVRVALGENIIRRLNESKEFDEAIEVVDFLAPLLTEAGQFTQAAAIFMKLTPEGQLFVVQRERNKVQQKEKQESQGARDQAKTEMDRLNAAADIAKVLKDKEFIGKLKGKVKKKSIDRAIDYLEGLKIDTKGKLFDAGYGLTASLWNTAISTIQQSLKAGYTISQAINRAVKKIKESGKSETFNETEFREGISEKLKDYRTVLDPEKAISEGLKDVDTTIDEVVTKHYTEIESTKKDLVGKLVSEANMDKADAEALAIQIAKKFDQMTNKAKQKVLNRIIPKPKLNKAKRKKIKELHNRIIEASNLGVLTDAKLRELYAEKLGTPNLTEAQAEKLVDLANKVQSAKPGFQKSRATQDLMDYHKQLIGDENWMDVGMGIWYANILSGPSTHYLNFFDTYLNIASEVVIKSIKRPKIAFGLWSHFYQGIGKRGWAEAVSVLKTGYDPIKGINKFEALPILERKAKTKGWNPLRAFRYVRRVMVANDIMLYHGLKAARAYELAMIHGKGKIGKFDQAYAKKMLGWDKQTKTNALQQAKAEGLTGRDMKRRAFEIMEEKQPELIILDSNNAAARGTYNYPAEGLLGQLANILGRATDIPIGRLRPLKFVIPFTNTIANIANEKINYFPPVAAWRYISGSIGSKMQSGKYYRKYTPEERADVMIKGIEGLLAMGILYALTDDDYGFFQVTANGTGDFKKNYELQETGWRPYTISFGDKWQFDYRVTPLAIPLSIIGYLRDAQKYQGEKDLGDKLSIIAFGAFRFMFDMTFLRGVSELFNTFSNENPGSASNFFERTSKYVQRTGKHFLIPNAVTQVSRSIQEVQEMPMKKAKGVLGEIIRDLPYLRDSLDNMYNVLGEPVIPDQLSRIQVFKGKHRGIRDAKSLEIWNIITDNQAWIGVPSRVTLKPDRSPMTDEEYDKFALKAGQLTKKALIKNLGRLKATKDKQKVRDMIQTIKTNARRQARIDVFGAEPLFKDLDLGTIF